MTTKLLKDAVWLTKKITETLKGCEPRKFGSLDLSSHFMLHIFIKHLLYARFVLY